MSEHVIFQAVRNSDFSQTKEILKKTRRTFSQILDNKSSTVLHVCCYNNNYDMVEYFLKEYVRRMQIDPDQYNEYNKKIWLQRKDNQGYTCLHYAVYKNNYKIAGLLQHHGADIYQLNSIGLSVMHIAAQGDSPLLLYYYMTKGFKIQVQDTKGSTPFHWACYGGKQNAVNALIAWGAELDCQDKLYGMTPLHLAVLSANGRVVKKLLVHGANRFIKDFNGKIALQKAKQNEYSSITQMLEDKFGWQQFYNLKQPYRKTKKPSIPFLIFLFLFISTVLLNLIFVLPFVQEQFRILFIILIIIPILFLILAGLANPGKLKSNSTDKSQIFQMMIKNESSKICFQCQILKPMRSKHCDICQSCIMVFDHHCPWINNCVGAGNYLYFFCYIVAIEICLVFLIIYTVFILSQKSTWEELHKPKKILEIFTLCYTLINTTYFLPVAILIYIQCKNCWTNETTQEKYSGGQTSSNASTNSVKNPSSQFQLEQNLMSEKPDRNNSTSNIKDIGIVKTVSYRNLQRSYPKNCLNMCFRNKNNLQYKIGG